MLIAFCIALCVLAVVELYCVAKRYEKNNHKIPMKRIFAQDVASLFTWLGNSGFKWVIVILFVILIYVLQTQLADINSNLNDISSGVDGIRGTVRYWRL